jgi:chromosomal replication initiator protein
MPHRETPAPCLPPNRSESTGSNLNPQFTFENFVVGKPNELAHAAARRVAEGRDVTFNPLFLYGGVGLGKTHLMHAIAWELQANFPEADILYLSAEQFMYRFVRALREQDTIGFKQMFRSVDVLMVDDVQFIAGKSSTQEEFFHTFNALVEMGKQIVISADRAPVDMEELENRIASRLQCGLVVDIHPPITNCASASCSTRPSACASATPAWRSPTACWNSSPARSRRTSACWKAR